MLVKGDKLPVIISEDLMYSMMAIVNTVLYTGNLLGVDLKHSHHEKNPKTVGTMGSDGYINYLDYSNHYKVHVCEHHISHLQYIPF